MMNFKLKILKQQKCIQKRYYQIYNANNGPTIEQFLGANPVRKFALDFAQIEKNNSNAINMAVGVPKDPTPNCIVQAKINFVHQSAIAGNNAYGDPRGLDSLRINLAKYYKESYNLSEKSLTNDKIVVTPGGSSYALTLSFEMLLRNSKSEGEIIVLAPFFGPYTGMIKLGQGLPVYVDTKDDFEPDLDKIEAKINEKTRGILINSPNNPTGKVYSDITIENIIKVARKHKVAVISDEVYEKFVYNDHKQFVPLSHFFEENPDVLLISNTSPSKTYGMIGDRIGYIMSNSEEFIKDIAISLGYRFASAPYISQVALDSVFQEKNQLEIQNYINELKDSYMKKGQFLVNSLNELGLNCNQIEGGMFVMVEVYNRTKMTGSQFSQFMMQQQEAPIAISPGYFFGDNFQNHCRFTTCPSMETLQKGIQQMRNYLNKIHI